MEATWVQSPPRDSAPQLLSEPSWPPLQEVTLPSSMEPSPCTLLGSVPLPWSYSDTGHTDLLYAAQDIFQEWLRQYLIQDLYTRCQGAS